MTQLILPQDPLGVFATTIATSLFNYFLATTLALLVAVIRKPRFTQLISFIPLMLGYDLGTASIYVGGKQINLSLHRQRYSPTTTTTPERLSL